MKNLICIYLFLCVIIPANLFAQKEGERIIDILYFCISIYKL
jgi:hypothetical protein